MNAINAFLAERRDAMWWLMSVCADDASRINGIGVYTARVLNARNVLASTYPEYSLPWVALMAARTADEAIAVVVNVARHGEKHTATGLADINRIENWCDVYPRLLATMEEKGDWNA